MLSIIIHSLMLLGCVFVLIAAIGVWRFPDFYTRLHAATKAGAFGGILLAIAAAFAFLNLASIFQALLIAAFFYVTTPVAAHLLGRAAYERKVEIYRKK